VRCARCGHGQTDPMPASATLVHAYRDALPADDVAEEPGYRATARRALARIARELVVETEPVRLVDLGCWVGFLLAEAREMGWQTTGVEPSQAASAIARDRLGVDVITGDLESAPLPLASFDAAVLGDVLEHLPDPGAALDRAATLLRPGGVAWFTLPDAGSWVARAMGRRWWSVIPPHVQFFTQRSIRALFARHGWTVVEITSAPKVFSVRYYLGRVTGYSPRLAASLVRASEAARVADRLWAPDFRDRMAIVARPPAGQVPDG
jgi:SAM-dependent methyltransferase